MLLQTLEEIRMETAREELKLVRAAREKEEILLQKARDEGERQKMMEQRIGDLEKRFSTVEEKQDKILEGNIHSLMQ